MSAKSLLEVDHITKIFEKPLSSIDRVRNLLGANLEPERVHAVDNVTFALKAGEAIGLVGESGCGKSTVARMIMGLLATTKGEISFRGTPQDQLSDSDFLKIQMVFQDPYSSLNPRMRIASQIREALQVHHIVPKVNCNDYMISVFEQCGIDASLVHRYPHQFSGGQRQRFGIARALAMQPDLMICDEPVAALDVSIQAQIINLFMGLRQTNNLTYLFISHDLGVVRHLCDKVIVMYLGQIVEQGWARDVLESPQHPYTQALKASSPRISAEKYNFEPVKGEIPSPLSPPPGCHFHPRCPLAEEKCKEIAPTITKAGDSLVRCHLF